MDSSRDSRVDRSLAVLADQDASPSAKAAATKALKDDQSVKRLVKILADDHEDKSIRAIAVEVVGKLGNKLAVDRLLALLRHEDSWLRHTSASALGDMLGSECADESLIVALLAHHADPTVNTYDKPEWLCLAADRGYLPAARLLLDHGADPNEILRGSDETPLHRAAYSGHVDVARLLVASGADLQARNRWGATPLHSAAYAGHCRLVQLLLQAGALVDAETTSMGVFDRYVSSGVAQPTPGDTPLHQAALRGHCGIQKLLLNQGAPPNALNVQMRTPLHEAARMGHRDAIPLLLEAGAWVNKQDAFGHTPLHLSLSDPSTECPGLLRHHGAFETEVLWSTPVCGKCGQPVDGTSTTCPRCGEAVGELRPSAPWSHAVHPDCPIAKGVKAILVADLDADWDNIGFDDDFHSDMGFDSLGTVELCMYCEDEFGVEISDEAVDGIYTPRQLTEVITQLLAEIADVSNQIELLEEQWSGQ